MRWVLNSLKGAWFLERHSDYDVSFWVLLIDSVNHDGRELKATGHEAYIAAWPNEAREAYNAHTYHIGPGSNFVPRGAP